MTAAIAPRHTAAVEALALAGGENILEIGCGQGVATRLMLEQLTTGSILALDRSAKMIDALRRSAPDALRFGRLAARAVALENAQLPQAAFDRIVAVNVDLTLRLGTAWPGMLKGLLRPGGLLVLAFDAPPAPKADTFGPAVKSLLQAEGFSVSLARAESVTVLTARIDSHG